MSAPTATLPLLCGKIAAGKLTLERGCVLEVETDEKGTFMVHFPEAQVWKRLTQLIQVEGILRGARARRRRKSASSEEPAPRRAVA